MLEDGNEEGMGAEDTNLESGQQVEGNQGTNEGGESQETPVIENENNWQEDKRFETFWKKDPNQLYGSYKSLEQKLAENGSTLKEYEGKIANLEQTNTETQGVIEYIEAMKNHPEYSAKLSEMVDGFNKQMRRDAYGADLPDHVVDKLNRMDALEEKFAKMEEEKGVSEQSRIIKQQMDEIKDLADKYNITYDKDEYLKWCHENKLSPSNLKANFVLKALEEGNIEASLVKKTQDKVIKNMKGNSVASMSSSNSKKQNKDTEGMSTMDKMLAALRK